MNRTLSNGYNRKNVEYIDIFLDEIIGRSIDGWPSLVDIFYDMKERKKILSSDDQSWLSAQGQRLSAMAKGSRRGAVHELERIEPSRFGRIVGMLYALYYSAPPVVAKLRSLAELGSEPAAVRFDPALVAKVVASGAGRRRL